MGLMLDRTFDQREWTVPCIDAVGRPRGLAVCAGVAGVVLGFPPAGSATIASRHARALAIVLAAPYQATAGVSGGERTAGSPGGCASSITTRPAVPELTVGPGRAPAPGPTVDHRRRP